MNIILIVSEGYPQQFSANNAKAEFIARGLKYHGCTVTMIDVPLGTKGIKEQIKGVSDKDIKYYIFPRKKQISTFFRNLFSIWKILKSEKQIKDNFVILGMTLYPAFIVTTIISSILGYKRTVLFHEWHIGMQHKKLLLKMEAWIKDRTFGYFVNGIFPISHFLYTKSMHFYKPQILLPIMASYDRVNYNYIQSYNFTYCGHAAYIIRNNLVLEAYQKVISTHPLTKLTLVLFGTDSQISDVRNMINKNRLTSVRIISQIPQDELYKLYDNSLGLLIPLDPNNLQDKARFSQKIAEYIGSRRPIITNSAGEIPYYFKNNENAIIVDYNASSFANGMIKLIENPDIANKIGQKGYILGCKAFEYKKNAERIINFLKTI